MANYTTDNFETAEGSIAVVLAALEAKIDTLDSTTNPIYLIKIKPLPNGKFIGVMVYD